MFALSLKNLFLSFLNRRRLNSFTNLYKPFKALRMDNPNLSIHIPGAMDSLENGDIFTEDNHQVRCGRRCKCSCDCKEAMSIILTVSLCMLVVGLIIMAAFMNVENFQGNITTENPGTLMGQIIFFLGMIGCAVSGIYFGITGCV